LKGCATRDNPVKRIPKLVRYSLFYLWDLRRRDFLCWVLRIWVWGFVTGLPIYAKEEYLR
jgi:hypothetical protein